MYMCAAEESGFPQIPSKKTNLKVRRCVTAVFRWKQERAVCCHLHISTPNTAPRDENAGLPPKKTEQSYAFIQDCLETQKKRIKAQTTELESIYNTIPCAIMRLQRTEDGYRFLTGNQALVDMLGKTEEELKALDWTEGFCAVVVPEDVQKARDALDKLKKPGDREVVDYCIKNFRGEYIHLSSSNALIQMDKGKAIIQRMAFDISKRVKLEAALKRMSFEDSLTGLYNRNRFSHTMQRLENEAKGHLGIACFDINGLKSVNDNQGHSAGDELICRAADHIGRIFPKQAYRIGGDEFVVIDERRNESQFREAVAYVCESMNKENIHISAGLSWRESPESVKEQYEEADRRMYEDKSRYYSRKTNDRRRR